MKISKLKAYLAETNTTLRDFSEKVDRNESYMSQIINGKHLPSWKLHRDILAATDGVISIDHKPRKGKRFRNNYFECDISQEA